MCHDYARESFKFKFSPIAQKFCLDKFMIIQQNINLYNISFVARKYKPNPEWFLHYIYKNGNKDK